jgi:hypothetical protein
MTQLSFFPEPREDELLFSLIGRYHILSGNISKKVTLQQLYGTENPSPLHESDAYLNHMFSKIPKGLVGSAMDIIWNHTLMPYYRPFESKPRKSPISKYLVTYPHGSGTAYSLSHVKHGIYFCPKCVEENTEKFGHGYWHRKHQLPGVDVCATHGSLLLNACKKCGYAFGPDGEFKLPNIVCTECGHIHESSEIQDQQLESLHIQFAKTSWQLMTAEWMRNADLSKLPYVYRQAARDVGFEYALHPYYSILETAFKNYYGEEFLKNYDCFSNSKEKLTWIFRLLHYIYQNQNTTHHILMIAYLFDSLDDLKSATIEAMNSTEIFHHGYTQEKCVHFSARVHADTKAILAKLGYRKRKKFENIDRKEIQRVEREIYNKRYEDFRNSIFREVSAEKLRAIWC